MAGFNVKDMVAQVKAKGKDMTEVTQGGGRELPAAGFVRLRLVGYLETGKVESTWQGQKKIKDTAELIFEASGPKHQPIETDNGKFPIRLTERIKLSYTSQSNWPKLFAQLNWEGKATHVAELLGNAFVAEIEHVKKTVDGKEQTYANLRNIRKPFAVNPETGDEYEVKVDPPLTEIKLFLWDFATPEMWDALYIPGEYEARKDDKGNEISPARSKNVIQEKIRKALNFKGLPIYDYACGNTTAQDTADLDAAVGDVANAETAPQEPDALDGVA